MNIKTILNNKEKIYFAHGSGTEKKNIIDSIMRHGIRCSHEALQYTSIYLGTSENINDYSHDIIENWIYRSSSIVFIISLPKRYFIFEHEELNTIKKEHAAYYYIPSKEEQEKYSLQNKPHVYSEFIVGYYNSKTKEFIQNDNYYEKQNKEKRKEIFNKIEQNYINVINESCGVDKYREFGSKYNFEYALDTEYDFSNIDKVIADIDKKIEELENEEQQFKKAQPIIITEIPKNLRKYVYIVNGKVFPKQKLPKELEKDYELFIHINSLIEATKKDEIDLVFDMYAELYEKKFNKKAYIAEPSGTKEQAIKAIKLCLEKNEDLLDSIYYPNKDVYYSEEVKGLNRKILVNIIENWNIKYRTNIQNENYLELLNQLENEINNYEYKNDSRFMTYGRREFLYKEFIEYLNEAIENNRNKYFNALINLDEYIRAESSFFNPSQVPEEQRRNFHKLLSNHDEYNKSNIICHEEKEILLQMISEFKNKL